MPREERLKLEDTPLDILTKLSEGNPGAFTVCMKILAEGGKIDPDDIFGGLGALMQLDTHGIYGSRIWMLYKDVCGENLVNTLAVLRACQLGYLSESVMLHATDNGGDGVNVPELVDTVKKRLPRFGATEED